MPKTHYISFASERLAHAEFSQFNWTSLKAIEAVNLKLAEHPPVLQCVTKLNQLLLTYDNLRHQEKPVSGADLAAADKKRDLDLRNIFWAVQIAQCSRITAKREAAKELGKFLENFKKTGYVNYEKESSLIRSILTQLEKSPYREKINQIGTKELIDNLKESQNEFYQLYLKYSKFKKQDNRKSLDKQRDLLASEYGKLYQYLMVMVSMDENSALKPVLLAINEVRKDYAVRFKRRQAKKNKIDVTPESETGSQTEGQVMTSLSTEFDPPA